MIRVFDPSGAYRVIYRATYRSCLRSACLPQEETGCGAVEELRSHMLSHGGGLHTELRQTFVLPKFGIL